MSRFFSCAFVLLVSALGWGCRSDLDDKAVRVLNESALDAPWSTLEETAATASPSDGVTIEVIPPTPALEIEEPPAVESEIPRPVPTVPFPVGRKLVYNEKVQVALVKAGFYDGEIDGKVGTKTREAIKVFQKAHGLHVDGMAGTQTWEKLKAYYEEPE